jgi:tagaturonate reductase
VTYYKGGKRGDDQITPNDDPKILALLQELWATGDTARVAKGVLGADFIWGEDLNKIPGLTAKLTGCLNDIQAKGMLETVKAIL